MFANNIFPEVFSKIAQKCYVEQMDAFAKLFEEPSFYNKVMEENGYEVKAYDIIDRGYGEIANFFNTDFPKGEFDIISNPPYDDKLCEVVTRCLSICKNKVALLFPLRYLSGKARYDGIFKKCPPRIIYVYSERICIAKNADFEKYADAGANKEIYAWYIWEKEYNGKTELRWLLNQT